MRGHEQRPRPADETGSCEWRSAPIFASGHRPAPQKPAKRKRGWRDARKGGETERGGSHACGGAVMPHSGMTERAKSWRAAPERSKQKPPPIHGIELPQN